MAMIARRSFLVVGAGAAVAGLAGCAQYAPTTSTPALAATPQDMLAAINQIRKQNTSSQLVYSSMLAQVALNQARLMVKHDQLSHNFGPGLNLRERATAVGYHGPIGENVAGGQQTLEAALTAWMNSSGHRFTLLSNMWKSVGMVALHGKPGSRYRIFWAADFGV